MRRTFADDDSQEMTPPRQPLRVLIADDHPLLRHSFRLDLEAAGIQVCAEAATGAAAVRAALAERPDLCLLDMRMPEGGGIAAAKSIRLSLPATKIVLITALPDEEGIMAAARAGADGFLAKDVNRVRLPYVLHAVTDGETTYPRRLLHPVLRALQPPRPSDC